MTREGGWGEEGAPLISMKISQFEFMSLSSRKCLETVVQLERNMMSSNLSESLSKEYVRSTTNIQNTQLDFYRNDFYFEQFITDDILHSGKILNRN